MSDVQQLEMNEGRIRRLLNKHNVEHSVRKFFQKELLNRKIHSMTIRDRIIVQNSKLQKFYMLIQGAVQISYEFYSQIEKKSLNLDSHNQISVKTPKYEHQKLTFGTIETQHQIMNEEAIIEYLAFEQKLNQFKRLQDQKRYQQQFDQDDENRIKRTQKMKTFLKANQVKNKYSLTVTSSKCFYIEIKIEQTKLLLKNKINQVKQNDRKKQSLIQQKRSLLQQEIQQNQKAKILQKLSLPNFKLKKLQFQQVTRSNKSKDKNQRQITQSIDILSAVIPRYEMKKVKSFSALGMLRNQTWKQNQIRDQFRINADLILLNQNQQILKRYHSKKTGAQLNPTTKSNQKIASLQMNDVENEQQYFFQKKQNLQDKIFKQNLKKIIRKKLNYEKKHGEVIRQFVQGERFQRKIVDQQISRINISKSYSKQVEYLQKKLQPSRKFKINTFYSHLNSKRTNMAKKYTLQTNKVKQQTQQLKQDNDQQKRWQQNQVVKNKIKMRQDEIFLKLQNLDSYFNQIQ